MKATHTLAKIETELDRLFLLIPERTKKHDTRIKGRMHQIRTALAALKEIIDPGQARAEKRWTSAHDTLADLDFGTRLFNPAF